VRELLTLFTTGNWLQLLGKTEATSAKVFPVKGQMLILDAPIGTLDTMVFQLR
jgi:glycerol-3-phosphate dehydrogenase